MDRPEDRQTKLRPISLVISAFSNVFTRISSSFVLISLVSVTEPRKSKEIAHLYAFPRHEASSRGKKRQKSDGRGIVMANAGPALPCVYLLSVKCSV